MAKKNLFKKVMSIGAPIVTLAGSLALIGYFGFTEPAEPAYTEGSFRGFPGRAEEEPMKKLTLYAETQGKGPYVHGRDWDGDGAFDEIRLRAVPAGHALRSVANPASLDSAYTAIMGGE